jgi:hypothetical protein
VIDALACFWSRSDLLFFRENNCPTRALSLISSTHITPSCCFVGAIDYRCADWENVGELRVDIGAIR